MAGVTFNGRYITHPGAYDYIDATSMVATNAQGSIPVVIGKANAGTPGQLQWFTSAADARAVLKGGDLCTALDLMFSPAPEGGGGASIVGVIVANELTQAKYENVGAAMIFTAKEYGTGGNNISVEIDTGSNGNAWSRKFTVERWDTGVKEEFDNCGTVFSLQYTGTDPYAVANRFHGGTKSTTPGVDYLEIVTGADSATATTKYKLDLTNPKYSTIGAVVDWLNQYADLKATLVKPFSGSLPSTEIDWMVPIMQVQWIMGKDIKTAPYMFTALGADIMGMFNQSTLVSVQITGGDDEDQVWMMPDYTNQPWIGQSEVDTLTVDTGATTSGNVTVTINGQATVVAVASGDSASAVATKIASASYGEDWIATASGAVVTFSAQVDGVMTAPTFADTGTTGVTATFVVTTAGTVGNPQLDEQTSWFETEPTGPSYPSYGTMSIQEVVFETKHFWQFPKAYLSGGGLGTTPTDWQPYLDTLTSEFSDVLVLLTDSATIHGQALTHVQQMEQRNQKQMLFVGGALGETPQQAVTRAYNLNSSRAVLAYPGIYYQNSATPLAPYFTAAMLAGRVCGVDPTEPITFDYFNLVGLEKKMVAGDPNIDYLISNGVATLESAGNQGIRLVQGVTTYIGTDNVLYKEVSVRRGADSLSETMRLAMEQTFVGKKGTPATIASVTVKAIDVLETALRNEQINGYRNVVVKFVGTVITIDYEVAPVEPINFILITSRFVPNPSVTVNVGGAGTGVFGNTGGSVPSAPTNGGSNDSGGMGNMPGM